MMSEELQTSVITVLAEETEYSLCRRESGSQGCG